MHRRIRVRPRFWVLLIALTVCVFFGGYAVTQARLAKGAQRQAALKEEYRLLSEEITALKEDIAFAQTDAYVERIARSELGLILPGEIRYVNGGY